MGFLGFGKREVIDLSERYKRQKARLAEIKKEKAEAVVSSANTSDSASNWGFFSNMANSQQTASSPAVSESVPVDPEERKKRLAKRLLDITNKLEELSNQLYHLQQRIEVLERKGGVGGF